MDVNYRSESLTIHHKVKDYASWRKGYDEHEKGRASAGVTNGKVFRRAEDENEVLIVFDVADLPKARAWLGGADLKAAMEKAGVVGPHIVRFAA